MSSVLIAEDDPAARGLLAGWLGEAGYVCETTATADALRCARAHSPDAVLVAIGSADHGSMWVLRALTAEHERAATLALTRQPDSDLALEARRVGALDCLPWPSSRKCVLDSVQRALAWRAQARESQHRHESLRREVACRREHLQSSIRDLSPYTATQVLFAAIEERSPDLAAHAQRVARSATALAEAVGLSRGDVRTIRAAALLKDLGKVALPASLLDERRPLDDEDIALVHSHVAIGADLLAEVAGLEHVADLVIASREWFDGSGYPAARGGTAIPLGARIIAVAAAYDTLTSPGTCDDPLSHGRANAELVRRAGTQLDPDVVGAWLDLTERARCC